MKKVVAVVVARPQEMTADTTEPEARFERFTLTYPLGTVLTSFYCGGVTLREAQIEHPLAVVKVVEDSRVEPSGA